jgi:hypothetical protein
MESNAVKICWKWIFSCSFLHTAKGKCMAKPTEGESRPQYKNKYYMRTGSMKYWFKLITSWNLMQMFEVPILKFNTRLCRTAKWLPDWLESSRCRAKHHQYILHSLLLFLDITDFCSTNSRRYVFPDKNLRDLNQGSNEATLLVHLILRCKIFPKIQV